MTLFAVFIPNNAAVKDNTTGVVICIFLPSKAMADVIGDSMGTASPISSASVAIISPNVSNIKGKFCSMPSANPFTSSIPACINVGESLPISAIPLAICCPNTFDKPSRPSFSNASAAFFTASWAPLANSFIVGIASSERGIKILVSIFLLTLFKALPMSSYLISLISCIVCFVWS